MLSTSYQETRQRVNHSSIGEVIRIIVVSPITSVINTLLDIIHYRPYGGMLKTASNRACKAVSVSPVNRHQGAVIILTEQKTL